MNTRRAFLAAAAGYAAAALLAPSLGMAQERKGTRLILLGNKGGPTLGGLRANFSMLLVIAGVPYVVDCGYGTSRQLIKAGVALEHIRHVFLTHLHSDHSLELGPLIYNAWATDRKFRIDAFGPPGTQRMALSFMESMQFDIQTRMDDEGKSDIRRQFSVTDFHAGGVILQNADVRVSACRVRHPPIEQAYAYRFDSHDRSVVISGDTAHSPELAVFATGADILVHECLYLPAMEKLLLQSSDSRRLREHLLDSHSTPEQAGQTASRAGVGTLVLSHLVPGGDPDITDAQWAAGARKHFNGRIIVGRDLQEI